MSTLAPNHRWNCSGWVIESNTASGAASITTEARNWFDVKSHLGVSSRPARKSARLAIASDQNVCSAPRAPTVSASTSAKVGRSLWLSVTSVPPSSSASSNSTVDSTPSTVQANRMVRSSTCSTRWCGSAPSGVKRPQNSYLPGSSTSACSASQTRSAAGSVSASYTTFGRAGTTARRRRSGSVIGVSFGIAGDGQAERVALGTAVPGEQVLQRLLQLVEECRALLRAYPDVSGHADRGQVGAGEVERGDVRLDVLHQVDQVAQAEPVAGLAQPDPADQVRGQPVGPGGRLVDPLVDAAHPALGHLAHQAGLQQALHVVVDALRGLAELDRHLGARPGLGELPQRFDPLRLEQGLSLLDLVEVDDVSHDESQSLCKRIFCQWALVRWDRGARHGAHGPWPSSRRLPRRRAGDGIRGRSR